VASKRRQALKTLRKGVQKTVEAALADAAAMGAFRKNKFA
jgi:hypothetical protein